LSPGPLRENAATLKAIENATASAAFKAMQILP
jgi:hypothetical protein